MNLEKIARSKCNFIMRICLSVFLVFILAHSFANSMQDTLYLSLKGKKLTIAEIFKTLRQQTGLIVFYNNGLLNDQERMDIDLEHAEVRELMDYVTKGKELTYQIKDRFILLQKKTLNKTSSSASSAGSGQPEIIEAPIDFVVTGVVKNENGEALAGVSVNLKGTQLGTTTGANGAYALTLPDGSGTLVFSYVGYVEKELPVSARTKIDVVLSASDAAMDQVVVIGYGTARKRDLTGSVSQVNANKLANETPRSVQNILRGNIAGLNIGFSASAKGGGSLQVRGRKSLNAEGSPLVVMDGVIYYGSLDDINPADIETIDVLKDASSAAVFGAKAANGVVMVTTKRGRTSKPSINVGANVGAATMEVNQPVYSAEGYLSFREDVMKSTNENARPYEYSDPRKLPSNISTQDWLAYTAASGDPVTVWLQRLNMKQVEIDNYLNGKSIDWYDQVFKTGLQQDYNISLSSSKNDLSYYFSLGYRNDEAVVIDDQFSALRSRLKLEGNVTSFLKVGINTQFSDRDESSVPVSWTSMQTASPWGSMYSDDGKTLRLSPQDDPAVTSNPLIAKTYTNRLQKYTDLTSTLYANVKLPLGITYQLNFSPRFLWYRYYNHQSSLHPTWALQGGLAQRKQSQEYSWQIDNLLKWQKTFNDHYFDVTLLANAEKFQFWSDSIGNQGFAPSDQLGFHNIGTGINAIVKSNDEYSTGDALMGRLFYSFKNRYLLTLSARRDGYSAFGQKHPRATFPSVAVGWVFTDESFHLPNWLSYGKLRFSYGINGNRDIGRYVALSQLTSGNYLHANPTSGAVIPVTTLEVASMSNPDLRWEKTESYNAGLDFSFLDRKIGGSIDLYNMSSSDLLVLRSLPRLVGYNSVITNLGEVQNRGFELSLNADILNRDNFSWRTFFNLSYNKNKILSLYGDMVDIKDGSGNVTGQKEADDITNKWFIGHAIDEIWDIKVLGVYQANEAADAARYGVKPGDFKLQDVNDDGKYTDADRQFLGNATPKFRGSWRNEFTLFNDIDISFMMYSYWGHKGTFNEAKSLGNGYLDRTNYYTLPYWTAENPLNDYARLSSSEGGATYNVYRSRSFLRLDNISIAYRLPQRLLDRARIQQMRVFVNSRNVGFLASQHLFWDPEYAGPTPRIFTFGINLTL